MSKHAPSPPAHKSFLPLLLFGVLVLGLVVVGGADERRVMELLSQAQLGPLLAAVLATGGSMLAMSFSFRSLYGAARHPLPFRRVFWVTMVCNAFNVILSTGGLSGTAVRSLLLKRNGVPHSVSLPVSMVQALLSNLVMVALCALVALPLSRPAKDGGFPVGHVILAALGLLLVWTCLMASAFFVSGIRDWGHRSAQGLLRRWKRMAWMGKRLEVIHRNLESCAGLLGREKGALGFALLCLFADWGCYATALGACFAAVGIPLGLTKLLITFSVVFLTTELSVTPSGLGITEGILAYVLTHRGIPLEPALAAILLFRAVYFVLPVAVAAAFQLDMIREGWDKSEA